MFANMSFWSGPDQYGVQHSVTDLITEHASTMFIAVVKGALFWGGIAMVLGFVLFFVASGRGWLDIRARKHRAARVAFAIVLFLVCVPMLAGAGVAHYLSDATVRITRSEIRQTASLHTLGGALVAPVVLAHLSAQGEYDGAYDTALSWDELRTSDVGFLTAEPTRRQAIEGVSDQLLRSALDKIPGYSEARKKQVLGFLLKHAEAEVTAKVHDGAASYSALFAGLKADADGQVSFEDTAKVVGMAFFARTIQPLIRTPYNSVRLQLILAALLVLLLAFGSIRGLDRWLSSKGANETPKSSEEPDVSGQVDE